METVTGDIKTIQVSKIKPYGDNPRFNEMAVDAVARSIEKYGYNQPIVVDTNNVIIVGHTRLAALKKLGWKKAEVMVSDLSESDARRHRIADNKIGEMSSWDPAFLLAELRDAEGVAEFFDESELKSLNENNSSKAQLQITQEQIDEHRKKMEEHHAKLSASSQDKLVEVICEECGEKFAVDPVNIKASAKSDAER